MTFLAIKNDVSHSGRVGLWEGGRSGVGDEKEDKKGVVWNMLP